MHRSDDHVRDIYVQYGCGFCAPPQWRNFDVSPTLWLERLPLIGRYVRINEQRFPGNVEYSDIVKGLPIREDSCLGVYASHVLEHLSLDDFRAALRNTFKILRGGGRFRLVVPDLETLAKRYIDSPSPEAAFQFMRDTSLGQERRPRSLVAMLREAMGNSKHLWMWDFKSLSAELQQAGFVKIRRCSFGDSNDLMFRNVEEPGRFEDAVGIECEKPGNLKI
mgnify:FL=1